VIVGRNCVRNTSMTTKQNPNVEYSKKKIQMQKEKLHTTMPSITFSTMITTNNYSTQ